MITKKIINMDCKLYDKQATVYIDKSVKQKAALLYFHGGGLLFGNRDDLPRMHLETFCSAGFPIITLDYPLAPFIKLDKILEDCIGSVNFYLENREKLVGKDVPYFLFGRSAGGYLALLTGRESFSEDPHGLLSYYGYGFLCDCWYKTPSEYYLGLPRVSESSLRTISDKPHAIGDCEKFYATYIYARQSGRWIQLFFDGREKYLLSDYSLRLCEKYPYEIFCAHSSNDTDVPFEEYSALCEKFDVIDKVVVSDKMHDFDRMVHSSATKKLLSKSLVYLEKSLKK